MPPCGSHRSRNMNIVLLNQFFPPAQAPTGILLANLASELAGRGHTVTVIASAAGYGDDTGPARGEGKGVHVVRAEPSGRHRNGIAAKMGDYLSFARGAWWELSHLPKTPDALVCMTTPPFIGLLAARLRKQQGIPYLLWCMDLYPEALQANGFLRDWNPLKPVLKALAREERRHASHVVALGPDMASLLAASGAAHIAEIPVWSSLAVSAAVQAEARALRRSRGWTADEVVFLYSGNMGRAHRAEEFAALAVRLRGSVPCCRFVFSGGGPLRAEWERRWGNLFTFIPSAPAGSCAAHLLAADVHLVSQQPEWMGVVVPSKFQAACALGRPVVFAGPPQSAVGAWIAESGVGWTIPPGESAAVERVAQEIPDASARIAKGRCATRLFEQRFTRATQCAKLIEQIEEVVKERT